MRGVSLMGVIQSIFNVLWYTLNSVIYDGVGIVYNLLLQISRTSIFEQYEINKFANRIYALIGIFMLFKVILSLITYVVNPDSLVDKEKGMANIGKNIIISLGLTLLVPYIFQEAYNLQTIILEDNALMSIVFGTNIETNEIDSAGDKMKFTLMFAFMQPNFTENDLESSNELATCASTYEYDDNGKVALESNGSLKLNSECFGTLESGDYSGGVLESLFVAADYESPNKVNDNQNLNDAQKSTLFQNYAHAIANQNFYLLHRRDLINAKKNEINIINYMGPLALVVGAAVLWILLIFCIDIAVRSVKLGFYQMIAPIPILSYIDPKSGKDGMFKKWYKACFSTYLSLFIRLLAIYLAIYVITSVVQSGIVDVVTGERVTNWWVIIFIIVGALIFAKQLPKILEDLTGVKLEGFTLNPLKKIENEAFGAKAIKNAALGVGTAGLVGGAALATGQGFRLGAMKNALVSGFKGDKFTKNFASSYGAAREKHQQLGGMKEKGVGRIETALDKANKFFIGKNEADRDKEKIEALKKITDLKDQATNIADKTDSKVKMLLQELESMQHIDPMSMVDRNDYYEFRNNPDGTREIFFNETKYDDAIKEAVSKNQQMIKNKSDEIDNARADFFDSQASIAGTAIEGIYKQMQSLMNSMSDEINQGFSNIGKSDINVSNFTAKNIKEAGVAAISARQSFEYSEEVQHHKNVSDFSQNNKK